MLSSVIVLVVVPSSTDDFPALIGATFSSAIGTEPRIYHHTAQIMHLLLLGVYPHDAKPVANLRSMLLHCLLLICGSVAGKRGSSDNVCLAEHDRLLLLDDHGRGLRELRDDLAAPKYCRARRLLLLPPWVT